MYCLGNGVRVDDKQAFCWYQKAVTEGKWHPQETNQGQLEAINKLGLLYYHGIGVKQDLSLARHYFKQACERNFKASCDNY